MSEEERGAVKSIRVARDFRMSVEIASVTADMWEPDETLDKSTAYVASNDGALFSVHLHDDRPQADRDRQWYRVKMYLDGEDVLTSTIRPTSSRTVKFETVRDSPTTVRPFVFGKVLLTEDPDDASNDQNFLRSLGSIRLELYRVRFVGKRPAHNSGANHRHAPYAQRPVHEKQKKATLSHQVTRGQPMPSVAQERKFRDKVEFIDPVGNPRAVFEVYYRSRELLELNGMIPMEPGTPNREPELLVVSSDDEADENERKKDAQRVKREKKSVKPEPDVITLD